MPWAQATQFDSWGDVARFARAFGESGAAGAVTVRREPAPCPARSPPT